MRECFLSSVRHANLLEKVIRCSEWQQRKNLTSHNCAVTLDKSIANGHTRSRQRGYISIGFALVLHVERRWKYFNRDTTYECGQAPETTKHLLQCPLHIPALWTTFNKNARTHIQQPIVFPVFTAFPVLNFL